MALQEELELQGNDRRICQPDIAGDDTGKRCCLRDTEIHPKTHAAAGRTGTITAYKDL